MDSFDIKRPLPLLPLSNGLLAYQMPFPCLHWLARAPLPHPPPGRLPVCGRAIWCLRPLLYSLSLPAPGGQGGGGMVGTNLPSAFYTKFSQFFFSTGDNSFKQGAACSSSRNTNQVKIILYSQPKTILVQLMSHPQSWSTCCDHNWHQTSCIITIPNQKPNSCIL